ncbi:MAG: adenosylcobinamide-GDP ribazoletransferase [Dehalococcoidia bacterium]|nr:adenosylcobinamide-GDP ribazoletransferase [Dehalococcoidia bacterium]MDZ4245899.1 adenosylcobinamide-GDP ribazoletransferase [Dehalococcoidia bacterium]
MGFLVALRFLTTLPVPWVKDIQPKHRGSSLAYFPLVGLILGMILVICSFILTLLLPSSELVNIFLLAILIALTGALHLDGFIDTCDGTMAAQPPEERLRIMSDTRVGAFGIVGVVILIMIKYLSLNTSIIEILKLPTLLLMPVLGRWAMVYSMYAFPSARKEEGLGLEFKKHAHLPGFIVATLITLVIVVLVGLVQGDIFTWIILMSIVWIVTAAVSFFFKSRLGGLTGDNYGAVCELAEVTFLVFILIYFKLKLLIS